MANLFTAVAMTAAKWATNSHYLSATGKSSTMELLHHLEVTPHSTATILPEYSNDELLCYHQPQSLLIY